MFEEEFENITSIATLLYYQKFLGHWICKL